MTEKAIKRKNFIDSIAPASVSFDELVREKLECGKFPLTKTGCIKVTSIIVSLVGIALFLYQTSGDQCVSSKEWFKIHAYTGCVGANLITQLLFYMIFSCGATVKYPGKWVAADIIVNLLTSLVGIIGSVMSTIILSCTREIGNVPGPLGIAGAIISIGGCAAIFLMYRYVEDEEEAEPPQNPNIFDPRKSMHA